MSRQFRTCDLNQPLLLPPSLQEWLPEGHLARFVADVVDTLDLSAIYAHYARKDGRGPEGYHPVLMVRLLIYGYCLGVVSSRRMERATYEDVAFRYLAAALVKNLVSRSTSEIISPRLSCLHVWPWPSKVLGVRPGHEPQGRRMRRISSPSLSFCPRG